MLSFQSIEELLPRANWSIYRLVRMASNRALELSEGKKCLIEDPGTDKVTTQALKEILAGKVECKDVADTRAAEEKKK